MGEQTYKGWDCCKSYPHPRTPVRIEPETATLSPHKEIYLKATNIHGDCDPGCFRWIHRVGNGYLAGEYGETNIFTAGALEQNCIGANFIELHCAEQLTHTAYITVSDKHITGPAYRTSFFRPQRFYAKPPSIWPPADPQPTGLARHHYSYWIVFWWNYYNCMDTFINKAFRMQFEFKWTWQPWDQQWRLYGTTAGALGGVYNTESEIPISIIYDSFPRVEDLRGRRKLEQGCCPAGIIKNRDIITGSPWS